MKLRSTVRQKGYAVPGENCHGAMDNHGARSGFPVQYVNIQHNPDDLEPVIYLRR
jgi:hypothetical protein